MSVRPIPKNYHTVTPSLIVKDAAQAVDFYKLVFGAEERVRLTDPQGKVVHAEIKIGDSPIMLGEETPQSSGKSPQTLGGTPVVLTIYVKNADELVDHAVAAGAKLVQPVDNQFYGDRSGRIQDPFGHVWIIATHIEDLTEKEMQERVDQFYK